MSENTSQPVATSMTSKLMRGAIWIAIGSLIAAAIVCVVWVLVGDQDGIIGRAFLTILLLAGFAGIAIVESNLAARRPEWLVLASMVSWIIVLLVGAVKIWLPDPEPDFDYGVSASSPGMRVVQLLVVVGVLQLALLHVRLYLRASQRYVTMFTRVVTMVTFAMLALLVAMLVFFLTFPDQLDYSDLYWRIVIALAILVAVGTTLIPLLNALFAPRAPRPQAAAPQGMPVQAVQAWPTYADGRTPLPVMPDGSPDWNAYYTGQPTYAAPAPTFPVVDATPQSPYASAPQDAGQAGPADPPAPFVAAPPAQEPAAPSAPVAPNPPVAPVAPNPPVAPPAPDSGAAPQAPPAPQAPSEQFASPTPASQVPPVPPAPPVPPGMHGSFPPPPTTPGGAQ